jgi:hypothetical protein
MREGHFFALHHRLSTDMSAEKTYYLLSPDRKKYPSKVPGKLGGHSGRRIYGRLDCPIALRAIANGGYVMKRVFFADEDGAVAAGYRPCARCMPERYERWMKTKLLANHK